MEHTRRLLRFCSELAPEAIPPEVTAWAADLFLDFVGVSMGSLELATSPTTVPDLFASFGGQPQSRIFGRAAKVPFLWRCGSAASALASPTIALKSAVKSFTMSVFQTSAVTTKFVARVVGAVQSSTAISLLRR